MSLFTRISVLTLLSIILSSLAAPGNLVSRQAPSGRFDTGYSALPEIEGSTLHQNWEMKGATFVSANVPSTSGSNDLANEMPCSLCTSVLLLPNLIHLP